MVLKIDGVWLKGSVENVTVTTFFCTSCLKSRVLHKVYSFPSWCLWLHVYCLVPDPPFFSVDRQRANKLTTLLGPLAISRHLVALVFFFPHTLLASVKLPWQGLICHIKCLAPISRFWWQTPNMPLWSTKQRMIRGDGIVPLYYGTIWTCIHVACSMWCSFIGVTWKVVQFRRICLKINTFIYKK